MAAPDFGLTDFYTGLTDTATDFTGSSTLQDVVLGSPIVLDTGTPSPVYDASVTDLLPQVPTSTYNPTAADMSQMLSGASDVPPNSVAATAQTPTPSVTDSSASSFNALNALSKFGTGLASLFGGQPATVRPAANRTTLPTGAPITSTAAYNSGPFTLVTVIVVGLLLILLLRSD